MNQAEDFTNIDELAREADPLHGAIISGDDPTDDAYSVFFHVDVREGHPDGQWYWDIRRSEWITRDQAQERGADFSVIYWPSKDNDRSPL